MDVIDGAGDRVARSDDIDDDIEPLLSGHATNCSQEAHYTQANTSRHSADDLLHITWDVAAGDDARLVIPWSTYVVSTIITAKTILGAGTQLQISDKQTTPLENTGIAALPRAFSLTGALLGTAFLLTVAWMTSFTVWVMARCSVRTHAVSYFGILNALHGPRLALLLQLCLMLRCAGLMTVYMVVIGDVLAGSVRDGKAFPGLVCQLGGGEAWCGHSIYHSILLVAATHVVHDRCSNRPLIIAIVLLTCIAPLVSARQVGYTENQKQENKPTTQP